MINKIAILLLSVLLFPILSLAAITEGGFGILYGSNHAFSFNAPDGWVLDNQSGVNQGLHAVFYPVGQTWTDSPVIAYARTATKDDVVRDIPSLVEYNVQQFRANGSPDYKSRLEKQIVLPQNKKASLYFFEGDLWGNYEAVGYVEEKETINFIVLTCRSKGDFINSLPAFESFVSSYLFIASSVEIKNQPSK